MSGECSHTDLEERGGERGGALGEERRLIKGRESRDGYKAAPSSRLVCCCV